VEYTADISGEMCEWVLGIDCEEYAIMPEIFVPAGGFDILAADDGYVLQAREVMTGRSRRGDHD
jgi:hypothetical protein